MNIGNDVKNALQYLPVVVLCSASFVLIYLNNFVDQFYINMNSAVASQAYTLSIPIYWTIISIAATFGTGAAIMVRKHWAEGDEIAANQSACNAIFYCATVGTLAGIVLYVFCMLFLDRYIEDYEVLEALDNFLLPFFILFVGISVNSVLCTLMAVDGGSRMSLVCLGISLILNIILDPIFVVVLDLDTFGNGLGTALSMTVTGLIAICWFRRHEGRLSIRLRYLKPSLRGVRKSLKALWLFLIRTVIGNLAELCIRLNLYLSYALSYGVPMLCASMSYVMCSGSTPALAPRYRELASAGDRDGAISLFRGSTLVMFAFMLGFTAAVYILAEPIIDLFTTVPGLTENRETIVWTLRVLCFTAPFIGLRSVCTPVFAPHSASAISATALTVYSIIRMIVFIEFLQIGYSEAIWFFLFERMMVGMYYLVVTNIYIRKAYAKPI